MTHSCQKSACCTSDVCFVFHALHAPLHDDSAPLQRIPSFRDALQLLADVITFAVAEQESAKWHVLQFKSLAKSQWDWTGAALRYLRSIAATEAQMQWQPQQYQQATQAAVGFLRVICPPAVFLLKAEHEQFLWQVVLAAVCVLQFAHADCCTQLTAIA